MNFTGTLDLWVKLVTAGTAAACLVTLVITGFELWRMPETASLSHRRSLRHYMMLSLVMAILCMGSAYFVSLWNERMAFQLKNAMQSMQGQFDRNQDYNKRLFQRFDAFAEKMKERDQRIKELSEELIVLAKAGKLADQDYSSVAHKLTLLNYDSTAMKRILNELKALKRNADLNEAPEPVEITTEKKEANPSAAPTTNSKSATPVATESRMTDKPYPPITGKKSADNSKATSN